MMLIKILLLAFVFITAIYFLNAANKTRTEAWKKIIFSLFVAFMAIAIILPDTTNRVAKLVGVGRGADLLFYILTVAFIFMVINVYLKFREFEQRMAKLSRYASITEAELRKNLKKPNKP